MQREECRRETGGVPRESERRQPQQRIREQRGNTRQRGVENTKGSRIFTPDAFLQQQRGARDRTVVGQVREVPLAEDAGYTRSIVYARMVLNHFVVVV